MASNNSNGRLERTKIIDPVAHHMPKATDDIIDASIASPPRPPPPSPSSSASSPSTRQHFHATQTQSPPSSFFSNVHVPDPLASASPPHHHINDGPEGNDDAYDSTLLKHETKDGVYRGNHLDAGSHGEPQLSKRGTSIEEIKTPLDDMKKVQPSLGTSMVQRTSTDREPLQKLRRHRPKIFTSKRMSTCIIASEGTRIICALIIAFLAILSYVDYTLFGRNIVKSESIVASRPLYILLLTDVTIVLALLHFEKLRGPEEAEEEEVTPPKDRDNWAKAEKVLERGLVVYQATRAIFIDCSVYLVVVICCLSLV